ncbi:MAG: PKD domain-containing protein, partial [Sphingobacteriales bacterium]
MAPTKLPASFANTINTGKIPVTANISVTPTYIDGTLSCAGILRTFRLTVLPTIIITPINNQVVCSGTIVPAFTPTNDAGSFAGATVNYTWSVSGTGTSLTNGSGTQIPSFSTLNETNGNLVTQITITAVYSFNNQSCSGTPFTYSITVQPGISNNTISANQVICNNTASSVLQGSTPAGGNSNFTYQWQRSTNAGNNWNDIPGAINISYDPGVLTSTTMYRRIVTTDLCAGTGTSTSNAVTITVGLNARASFIALKDTGCAPFVLDNSVINLQTFPQNTTYNWYANGVFLGAAASFPGYTITDSKNDVLIKLVAVNGCKADSLEHRFYTYPTPVPAFTISTNDGCGPLTVLVDNTTPEQSLFRYEWDFGNGQRSTLAQTGSIIFEPNPNFGDTTYTIQLKVMSSCETMTVTKTVHVKSKPKALFAPNSSVGCSPMTVVFSNTSPGIGNTYTWDFGDGTTLQSPTAAPVTHTFN